MGKKDGPITMERLEMFAEQVLPYENFSSLNLP
jgi:exopolyphosphatase/guanosine-5'-triphosphate,3'-diphosphate pyrophosphatase